MPKVSEEHLAARREQILDAAQTCFLRSGFHAASMSDVFAEAGLSAGAVYRYFKGKDEIIAAIAQRTMGRLGPFFEELLAEDPRPSLEEAMVRFAETFGALTFGPVGIGVQVWAAATYDDAFTPLVSGNMARIRGYWTELARREMQTGGLAEDADAEAVGASLFAMALGFILQLMVLKDVTPETLRRGLQDLRGVKA